MTEEAGRGGDASAAEGVGTLVSKVSMIYEAEDLLLERAEDEDDN
jgi:hypothetical protein